ncbi:MAG TPA: DUF4402 domain-containing protein [Holophagaceae bacterium]|nr:DUF4402 domain-containing protein [Holophagaceae bacterium]
MSFSALSALSRRFFLAALAVATLPALSQAWVPVINKYSDISLGYVIPSAFGGTVVLASPSGNRSASGGAALGSSAGVSLGSFTLSGKVGDSWFASAGSPVPFPLVGPGGATVVVTAVDCQPATSGTFPSTGTTGYYYLGATVTVGSSAATPAGTYTGSYTLNVMDPFKGAITPMAFSVQIQVAPVISLTELTGLRFGAVFTSPAPGTVVLSPAGTLSTTGGVSLGSQLPVGPATFSVTGAANATYAITLPGSVVLSSPDGTLTVTGFTSSPGPTGRLDLAGRQTLSVGGTLNVAAGQPDGDYAGTFSVTVAYN